MFAVTVAVPPAVSLALAGVSARFGERTTVPMPEMRTYGCPQALFPTAPLGSEPQTGLLGVSVATTSAFQSSGNVGKVSCTEQLQPARSVLLRLANSGLEATRLTLPPQGGLEFAVQDPLPTLSRLSVASVLAPPRAQVSSR